MKKYLLIISALIMVPLFGFATDFPGYPIGFWGEATINGEDIPQGETIKAFCDDNLIGEVELKEDGIYGYSKPTKQKLLTKPCESTIVFKYDGTEIEFTGEKTEGDVIEINLNFEDNTESNTGNSGSSPSGGGGSSSGSSSGRSRASSNREDDDEDQEGEVLGEDIKKEPTLENLKANLKNLREENQSITKRINLIKVISPKIENQNIKTILDQHLENIENKSNEKQEKIKKLEQLIEVKEDIKNINTKKGKIKSLKQLILNLKEKREETPQAWDLFYERLEEMESNLQKDLDNKEEKFQELLE